MLVLLCGFFGNIARAQAQHDRIEGVWLSESGKAKMQVYRTADGAFSGKIVWLKEPLREGKPKVDARNPDERLRNRPIIGLQILKNLQPAGGGDYKDGTVYDPKAGKSYDCKATIRESGELALRGYLGLSLLGRTMIWTRTN